MTARQLLTLFDSVYLAALSAWIGGAIFFTFGLVPILWKTLGAESARALVRTIYPRYYLGAAISGAVALAAFVAGPLCYHEYRGAMVGVQALAIIFAILLMLYGGNSLTPALLAAGVNEHESGLGQFAKLQRRAAGLNVLALLIGLTLLVAYVARPRPRLRESSNWRPRNVPATTRPSTVCSRMWRSSTACGLRVRRNPPRIWPASPWSTPKLSARSSRITPRSMLATRLRGQGSHRRPAVARRSLAKAIAPGVESRRHPAPAMVCSNEPRRPSARSVMSGNPADNDGQSRQP